MAASSNKAKEIFINNNFVAPQGQELIAVHNPSNGQVIAHIASCNQADVDAAVAAARAAFPAWSTLTGAQRAVFLRKIAQALKDHKRTLAPLETLNMGKPRREADWDLDDMAHCFEYFAEQAEALDARQGSAIKLPDANFKCELRYDATGVVAAIIPWNYPLLMLAWKVAPALAAGCTLVLKPSEYTPLTALEFARITAEAGLPAGVFNLVTGAGAAGTLLVEHKDVDKVAFTGSVPTGIKIGVAAAKDLKNLTLELGGKSPAIVFDDCDFLPAIEWIMFGVFWTNGQVCSSTSRLLVHDSIADRFLARLAEEARRVQIGDPNRAEYQDRTGMLGPLVSAPQLKRVQDFVSGAVKEGATVLCGGKAPVGDEFKGGYYIEPTILQVTANMTIWKEEVFGPVLSVMRFKTEEEAVKLANDSFYGLGAAVLSQDQARCDRVVRALRVGLVWVNCSQPCFCEGPWGGTKRSGNGTRELGPNGIDNYLEVKSVTTYVAPNPLGWYQLKTE